MKLRTRLLALAGVGALDLVRTARRWPVPIDGALDEPAHLLTAGLLLATARPSPRFAAWALAGSTLIDADHVPLYLGHMPTTIEGGRPVTHSLLTVGVLGAASRLAGGRGRTALAGLAVGVCLHFARDVATGGVGVPLLWPVDDANLRVPYAVYAAALAVAAGVATGREWRLPGFTISRGQPARRPSAR